MKKTLIAALLMTALQTKSADAQTLQEGINHMYADRFTNAVNTFQKILSVNPNVIEATYWLGQTYLDMDDNEAARQLYDKALLANGNAPLIMVGKGHVLLLEKKLDEARQMFESALTISRTKKGDDPIILNAIGSANVDAKQGNIQYAIEKLEMAFQKDPKNAVIALNLGNAYRKANPGSGGSKAYELYKKALELNPNFVYPYIRIAKLFETQKNWELFLENLNKATSIDPQFSLAYYELFYYYFLTQKYDDAEAIFKKYVASRPGEDIVEQNYLNSQLCWAKKDYTCAIEKAESVKAARGAKVKPKALRQLAYSYVGKGDFINAKVNIDEFFNREKDGYVPGDYTLKAEIYAGIGAPCEQLFSLFLDGAATDSVLQSKTDYLVRAADYFRSKNCKMQEADMRLYVNSIRLKPRPSEFANIGILYSQAGNLKKADSLLSVYSSNFPDSIYGYSARGRINYMLDTTMMVEPFCTNMVTSYQKTLDIASLDKIRFRSHGLSAARTLSAYFINIKNSRDTALIYAYKGLEIDSTDGQLKYIREILEKAAAPATKPGNQPKTPSPPAKNNTKPVSVISNQASKNSVVIK